MPDPLTPPLPLPGTSSPTHENFVLQQKIHGRSNAGPGMLRAQSAGSTASSTRALGLLTALLILQPKVGADPVTPASGSAVGVYGEAVQFPSPEPSKGTLVHGYPFELPAARGLAQPSLSLVYRSTTRDADAGFGWGLELPIIETRPLSGWPGSPGNGAALKERFAFNGNPLVAVCTTGSATVALVPTCRSTGVALPSWAVGGWSYYRLQTDTTLSRFFMSPNRRTWRVQAKGGVLLEFGEPITQPDLTGAAIEAEGEVFYRWRLVRQIESARPRNVVAYSWRRLGRRGLLYLNDIWHTTRASGSITRDGFAHHTQLSWEPYPFPVTSYAHLDRASPDQRLVRVAVASATWDGMGPREVIRVYRLSYYDNRDIPFDPRHQAPLFHHSFLREIRMEGRCGQFEDARGEIPLGTQCYTLPPTIFEYQGGVFSGSWGSMPGTSSLSGGPPNLEVDRQVLPFLNSASVVDFTRDGLPDVVQSWEAEPVCFKEPGAVTVAVVPVDGQPTAMLQCHRRNPIRTTVIGSARPMIGYQNRGTDGPRIELLYNCMDAGDGSPNSLPWFIRQTATRRWQLTSFLTAQGAATLVGPYGDGVLMWGGGEALFRPFRAVPVPADPIFCSAPGGAPGWRWQLGSWDGRAWPKAALIAPQTDDTVSGPRWYTDIDGDGLVDALGTGTNERVHDHYAPATPAFTRRFGKGDPLPGAGTGPAQIPFCVFGAPTSLVPHRESKDSRFFYTDIQGDGLVDLVRLDKTGPLVVRPGDGRGRFACDVGAEPLGCSEGDAYLADAGGGIAPWTSAPGAIWPDAEERFLHDVTGDGLADIITYRDDPGNVNASGTVRLWINIDGRRFRCTDVTTAPPCLAGRVIDDMHGTTILGSHRVTFADMDANGTDDLVVLSGAGVFVVKFFSPPLTFEGRSPQPGLLIRIRSGMGATTDIVYESIQELMLDAESAHDAWNFHVPAVENVVTRIRTHNHPGLFKQLPEPYHFDRRVSYEYRDPAYDPWERRFVGFRKVRVKAGTELAITETTYWFGPCQRAQIDQACLDGGDDDPDRPLVGLPVLVDRYVPDFGLQGPMQRLWSVETSYENQLVFDRQRDVRFASVAAVETYDYDPDKAVTFRAKTKTGVQGRGDPLEHAPLQGERAPVTREFLVDSDGNIQRVTERGRQIDGIQHSISGAPSLDPVVVTWLGTNAHGNLPGPFRCDSEHWRCVVEQVSVGSESTFDSGPHVQRRFRFTYTSEGDLATIEGWLAGGTGTLVRRHAAGKPVAPLPPGTSVGPGFRRLATYMYDRQLGGQTRIVTGGRPASCTDVTYDSVFGHLPASMASRVDGCASAALETNLIFHRGFEQVQYRTGPNRSMSALTFDPFGRPAELFMPKPDGDPGDTILTARFDYVDDAPLSWVEVTRSLGGHDQIARSIGVFNGLGEQVLSFAEDDGAWSVEDWTETNNAGQVWRSYRPFFFGGDPKAKLVSADGIPLPPDTGKMEAIYDSFGRLMVLQENDAFNVESYRYKPFEVEIKDIEPGGNGFVRVRYDGHGRMLAQDDVTASDTLTTEFVYALTGEPTTIKAQHAGGRDQVVRHLRYDSFGRLVAQFEPNVGWWRYAWDDAGRVVGTSDERGCGVNLHYDGVGRVRGEDYSPCDASHPPYSVPNVETGEGLEAAFLYDDYEPGQVAPEPGFIDSAKHARGLLVAVRDRGSHTRFNYDSRGRVRRVARRIAKPLSEGSPGLTSYASHWYISRLDYDDDDRLTRRTTGVEDSELLVNGQSEERYAYTRRDLIRSVSSSYGSLLRNASYDADGRLNGLVYGDSASTTVTFAYDKRRRLIDQRIFRAPPPLWSIPKPTYPIPSPTTTPTEILHNRFTYDDLGNPTVIEELSSSVWPVGAAPINRRQATYDDHNRLTHLGYNYATPTGDDPWVSPHESEILAGNEGPVPLQWLDTRVREQSFAYDWLGNVTFSDDDLKARVDRSLGYVTYGSPNRGPNQLHSAAGIEASYDAAGNLIKLMVERGRNCKGPCSQRYAYDWDEIGQLVRARRWDFDDETSSLRFSTGRLPRHPPRWDLHYAYTMGERVLKSVRAPGVDELHTLEVFDTLRIDGIVFDRDTGDYRRDAVRTRGHLGGIGQVFVDGSSLPRPDRLALVHVYLRVGDHLGSNVAVIDLASSELVERTTYFPFGAIESDYRPERWHSFREPYKFTGKEEDVQVALTYFGVRYYQPYLGRWLSPDPLSIHGLEGDSNPYAYVSGQVLNRVDPVGLDPCAGVSGPCQTASETIIVVDRESPSTTVDAGTTIPTGEPRVAVQQGPVEVQKGWSHDVAIDRGALTLENTVRGTAHISLGGQAYITASGVRTTIVNAATSGVIQALDPIGYLRIAKTVGYDVTGALMFPIGEDKNDDSEIYGDGAVFASSLLMGRMAGAPLSRGGGAIATGVRPTQRLIPAYELLSKRVTAGRGSYRGITKATRQWARRVYTKYGGIGKPDVAHITPHVFTRPGQSVLVRPQAMSVNRAEGWLIRRAAQFTRAWNALNPSSQLPVR